MVASFRPCWRGIFPVATILLLQLVVLAASELPRHKIVVLTQKRHHSLGRLIDSLLDARYEDDVVDIDFHVDQIALPALTHFAREVDLIGRQKVLDMLERFEWPYGKKRIQENRVFKGIRGQWLGAYVSPFAAKEGAVVVILEDDIEVSPWFFYWLKRAHKAFANRTDVAGFSLQRRKITASGAAIANVQTQNNTPYLQLQVGPWGFSPRRQVWARFVQEYDNIDIDQNTLISSAWYRKHQEEGRSHAMWTHHFLSYCREETLYTVFPNLPNGLELAVHREVDGEHFSGSTTVGTAVELQQEYTVALASFEPDRPLRIDVDGWGETAGGSSGADGDHNRSGVNFVSTQIHRKARRRLLQAYGDVEVTPPAQASSSACAHMSSGLKPQQTPFGYFIIFAMFVLGILLAVLRHFCSRQRVEALPIRQRFNLDRNLGMVLEFLFLLLSAAVGEFLLPSRTATTTPMRQMDLWCVSMAASVLIGLSWVETVKEKDAFPLHRRQTNEWKGWMQVAFVMYHYCYAEPLFAIIRVFVSAYVWMTGFGNGIFFWSKSDFSAKRFFQCIWRINFLVVPLSLVTKTPWILYYVVALHTTHFVLIYLCLAAAKNVALKLRWRKQNEHVFATWSERIVGIVVYFLVILVLWDVPAVYTVVVDLPLRVILGDGFADYFQYRTYTDHWSSWTGLLFAAFYPAIKKSYIQRSADPFKVAKWLLCLFVTATLAAVYFFLWLTQYPPQWDHTLNIKYARTLHPFIGTLMIPFYIFVRNAHPEMTKRVLVPFEKLGSWSLETYLLQFHIFLNRQASFHAVIVPTLPHVNMIWCMILYIACAARLFYLSNMFREIAFSVSRAGLWKAIVGLTAGIGVCFGIWNAVVFRDFKSTWQALYGVVYVCAACVLVAQCAMSACAVSGRKHQHPNTLAAPSLGEAAIEMVKGDFSEKNPMSRRHKDSSSSLKKQEGAPPHAGESASSCCIRYTGGRPQKDDHRVYWLKAFCLVSLWVVGHVQLEAPYAPFTPCPAPGDVGLAKVLDGGDVMLCKPGSAPCIPLRADMHPSTENASPKGRPVKNGNAKPSCKCDTPTLPWGHWKGLTNGPGSSKQCAANPKKFGATNAEWEYDPSCCACFEFTRDNVKQCMAGRHILFVGDSTTRQPVYDLFRFLSEDEETNKHRWEDVNAYVADIDGWLTKYAGSGESWFYRPSFDIHDMQLSPPTTLMKNLLKLNITLHPCRKRGESTEEPWAHGLWNDRTNRESFAYACPSHRIETTDLTYHDQSTNATVDWKYLAQQFGLDDVDFWPLYFQKNQPDMVYISKGNHDIRNGVALFNEDASVFNFFETTLTLLGLIRRHYSGPIIWRHNFWWSDPRYNTSRYRTVVEKIIKRYPGVVVLDGYRMTEHGCGGEGQPDPKDFVHFPAKISPLVWETVVRYTCRDFCNSP
jgi:hypothetical protein